jgi:hypothetical protein
MNRHDHFIFSRMARGIDGTGLSALNEVIYAQGEFRDALLNRMVCNCRWVVARNFYAKDFQWLISNRL